MTAGSGLEKDSSAPEKDSSALETDSSALGLGQETALCSMRAARALAVLTGLLYFFAFPGIDIWPLAFVAWVPLLVAMRGRSWWQTTQLAWISGFTMTFVGFYWMLEMLQTFSGFSAPVCVLFMALLAVYQGGRIALMGFIYGKALSLGYWRGPCFAVAFAVSEHLYPLLFPWYFGATVHQVPLLTQVADLGNPIVVGLVLSGVNYALTELLIAYRLKQRMRWRLLGVHAGVLALTLVYGALRLSQVDEQIARADKGRVGIVQANMGLMAKRQNRREGLRRHVELSEQLKQAGPLDLIAWSETAVAGAVAESKAEKVYGRMFTRQLATPVLFGALLTRKVDDARGRTYFNAALMSDAEGKIVGRYDKHKLLAFGEYLPLGEYFPILYQWSPNTGKFTPGDTVEPLPASGRNISAHICYEDVLPGFINGMFNTESDVDLIVNLTNDAWYGDTTQPWIHLALATFRAIEHRRYLVRSTNSGVSAFVDAAGRVVQHTEPFEQVAVAHEVAYLTGGTPYEAYGNLPWWLLTAVAGVVCFVPRRKLPWLAGAEASSAGATQPINRG